MTFSVKGVGLGLAVTAILFVSGCSGGDGDSGALETSAASSLSSAATADSAAPSTAATPTLIEGTNPVDAPAINAPPALGDSYVDPVFGTTIHRSTGASQVEDRDLPEWVRHEYSRRPAFNADGSRVLMTSSNGWLRLYDMADDGSMTFDHTPPIATSREANWHPSDPDVFTVLGTGNGDVALWDYDASTQELTSQSDLTGPLQIAFGSGVARITTHAEGRPSNDGNTWCLMVADTSGNMLGIAAYDRANAELLGSLATTNQPDHVSTSASGDYCVVSWAGDTSSTRAYPVTFDEASAAGGVELLSASEHSDTASTPDGQDVLVAADFTSGFVTMVDVESGERTDLFSLYGPNSSATSLHISGAATDRPGWVVVSFYNCRDNTPEQGCAPGTQWFNERVVAVELVEDPRILNLAHNYYGDAGYFAETQAVPNRGLSHVLFASTWESTNIADVASYLIEVPDF